MEYNIRESGNMKKTALFVVMAVLMVLFIAGCLRQPDKVVVDSKASAITSGQSLQLGNTAIAVIPTPGHTQGSICLSVGDMLFAGDTLFKGAVGRTNFPGGSEKDLQLSLRNLDRFPAVTYVLPGHGEASTLGDERENNPFLQHVTDKK